MPQGGGDGMLVTEGGYFGGYGFYIVKGKPTIHLQSARFAENSDGRARMPLHLENIPWCLILPMKVRALAKGEPASYQIDGKEVAKQQIPHTIPFIMTLDETFDIGSDTRTGVEDNDYKVPFVFKGKIDKVTVTLKR